MLIGIDQYLTLLTLKSERIEHRYSQRGGRLIKKGLVWTHEQFGELRAKLGWNKQCERIFQTIEAENLPLVFPRYPSLNLKNETMLRRVEELLSGTIRVDENITIQLESLSWLQDPLSTTFSVSRLQFHSLEWVGDLIQVFHDTNRRECLALAIQLTRLWMNECLHCEDVENVWSDHGTSLRAVILCQLWVLCRKTEATDSGFHKQLLTAMVRHGEKLSHPSFYRRDHNHGVTQAYSLFLIGVLLRPHRFGAEWMELGRARLEAQIVENVSEEGLHREHSPYYHFFVFRHFFYAYRFAAAAGITFSPEYTTQLERMLSSGVFLLKPDGRLSALGDTAQSSPILIEDEERTEWPIDSAVEYLYGSSAGREGQVPKKSSVLFPDAGMACFRSGWGGTEKFVEERCMGIRTATFDTTHIHRDVGSFELYGYGDDLIVDSGGPYAYGHPLRGGYFLTTKAHNTVVVDGLDQEVGQSKIIDWQNTERFDSLHIEHENYSGTAHNRFFIFVRPEYFIILDHLNSNQERHYSQIFHLHEHLEAFLKHKDVMTENPYGGPTIRIIPFFLDDLDVRLHKGSLEPRQGWRCLAEKSKVPNVAVEYHRSGRSVQFGVLLVPEPPGCPRDAQVEVLDGGTSQRFCLRVRSGDNLDEIAYSGSDPLTVKQLKA